ncbi:MAG: peptidylprolyl isomerase [Clostridia bacterium]|nr:peptidylprolyl isomerase [Clostridia bacterium]
MSKNNKVSVAGANEAARKQKRNSIIITVCVILAAVAVLGLAVYNYIGDDISGIILRNSTVAETDHWEVNGAMMAYMYSANVQSYSYYFSLLSVDTTVSLKDQLCPLASDVNGTWYDYLMDTTKSQAKELITFAEGAKANGMTLTAEEEASLDAAVANIEAEAATYGYPNVKTYLLAMTGNNIKVSDVRDCLELNLYANKYYTQIIDSTECTAEARESYYAENPDAFNFIDIYKYDILSSDFEEYGEDGNLVYSVTEQSKMAKEHAEELAAITSTEEFYSTIKLEIAKVTEQRESETAEQYQERLDALHASARSEFTPVSGLSEAVAEWAKTAKEGDTFVDGVEGATKYTVYMLVKPAYRNEKPARDVRHILFSNETYSDDAKAQEVLAEFVAAGATEAEFERLAKEYSYDSSAEDGGLIENVTEGQMVEEFENWLFDETRKVGDYGMVETEYGWHLMFYPGEGDLTSWEVAANTAIKNKAADDYLVANGAAITFNEKAIAKIKA